MLHFPRDTEASPDAPLPLRAALAALLAGAVVLHFLWLAPELLRQNYADDLFWYIPVLLKSTADGSVRSVLRFIFSPVTEWGIPSVNVYHLLLVFAFGNDAGLHSLAGVFVHYLDALLFMLCLRRVFRLHMEDTLIAGIFFITFFAHFHSYTWSMAIQHHLALSGVFSSLLLFNESESRRMTRGLPVWQVAVITLFFLSLSLLRTTIVLAAVMVAFLAIFRARRLLDLLTLLRFWFIPLTALFAFVPVELYRRTWGWQVERFAHFLLPDSLLALAGTGSLPGYYLLFLFGVLILFALVSVLASIIGRYDSLNVAIPARIKAALVFLVIALFAIIILLNYPDAPARLRSILGTFLVPTDYILTRVTFVRWQSLRSGYIPSTNDWLVILLFFALIILVLRKCHRLIVFLLLPSAMLQYLQVFIDDWPQFKAMGIIPSRYSIYFSPLVSAALAIVVGGLIRRTASNAPDAGTRARWQATHLVPVIACFGIVAYSVSNLYSIRERLRLTYLSNAAQHSFALLGMKLGADLREYAASLSVDSTIEIEYQPQAYHYDLWFAPGTFANEVALHPFLVSVRSELAARRMEGRELHVAFAENPRRAEIRQCQDHWCDAHGDPLAELHRMVRRAAQAISDGSHGDQATLARGLLTEEPYFIQGATNGMEHDAFLRRVGAQDWVAYWRMVGYDLLPDPEVGEAVGMQHSIRRMIRNDLVTKLKAIVFGCYLMQGNAGGCAQETYAASCLLRSGLNVDEDELFTEVKHGTGRQRLVNFFERNFACSADKSAPDSVGVDFDAGWLVEHSPRGRGDAAERTVSRGERHEQQCIERASRPSADHSRVVEVVRSWPLTVSLRRYPFTS